MREIAVLDRVGGGDGFFSGMAYAFLNGLGAQTAVDCGAAHGALAMITAGDNAMTSLAEVKALAGRGGGDPLTRDDLRLLKMTPMKTSQQGITP